MHETTLFNKIIKQMANNCTYTSPFKLVIVDDRYHSFNANTPEYVLFGQVVFLIPRTSIKHRYMVGRGYIDLLYIYSDISDIFIAT